MAETPVRAIKKAVEVFNGVQYLEVGSGFEPL
jgi:hypothetical protein